MKITIYVLLLVVYKVSSEGLEDATCDARPETDWEHNTVDPAIVCSGQKPCIVKCCFKDEVLLKTKPGDSCRNIEKLKKRRFNFTGVPLDYSTFEVYKRDVRYKALSSKRLLEDFTLLNSPVFWKPDKKKCHFQPDPSIYILSEDGYLVTEAPNHYHAWETYKNIKFCVDIRVRSKSGKINYSNVILVIPDDEDDNMIARALYYASAMTVSSLFLALVMAVYALLHQLRNMKGMLLLGYVSTLFLTFALKASDLFYRYYEVIYKNTEYNCTVISQIIYFLMLASFFWMNVMSFDLWWTFRGIRKKRDFHRRGINVKFVTYALYAYGMPAGITIFAAVMDRQELPPHIVKPFFNSCLNDNSFFVYLYVPVMILMGMNCLLFLMTIYNIWLIRRTVSSFNKADHKGRGDQKRFWLYVRLASLTGVGWVLELSKVALTSREVPLWLDIVLSLYSMFSGPIIFIMFVCKRNILVMLCKRFNIRNKWTRNGNNGGKSEQGSRIAHNSRTRSTATVMDSEPEVAS